MADEPREIIDITDEDENLYKIREKYRKLKEDGNACFVRREIQESIKFYTEAIDLCPDEDATEKSILFNNRAAAYFYLDEETGPEPIIEEPEDNESGNKNDESEKLTRNLRVCIEDCNRSIELNESYLKPYLKRAKAHRRAKNLDSALQDFEKVVELHRDNREALIAINELKNEINERNEKLKDEMLSKLKTFGNTVLNKFGLSTDNFQLQDNGSGGYSINFKR